MAKDVYLNLYKEGLSHLDFWLKDILQCVKRKESVTVLGMPYIGVSRVLDYVIFNLKEDKTSNVVDLRAYSTDFYKIAKDLDDDRLNILVEPAYNDLSLDSKKSLISIVHRFKDNLILIVGTQPSLLVNMEDSQDLHTIFLRNIVFIKPLDYAQTCSLIKSRLILNKLEIPEEKFTQIYQLSGGHGGFIKHLCLLYKKYKDLNLNDLINEPVIKIICKELITEIDKYPEELRSDIGLYKSNGIYFSDLLSFYANKKFAKSLNLTDRQKYFLEFMLSKKGEVVKREEIEDFLFSSEEFSMWGFYKFISRFRDAISSQYSLTNVYDKGYIIRRR